MDSTVIQPSAGQAILATSDHTHGHRGHDDHGYGRRDWDRNEWERTILREQAAGFRAAAADRVSLGNEIQTVGTAGALASCKTDDVVAEVGKDLALGLCKVTDTVNAGFFASQKQVSDAATSTVVGFKDAQATAYQIEGRALLEAAKNANALAVQATANFNAIQVDASKNAAAAQLEAQKNAAAAALEASKNHCAISAQLAACCCELKELTRQQATETRDLVNSIERDRQSAQIVQLQQQVAILTGGLFPARGVQQ